MNRSKYQILVPEVLGNPLAGWEVNQSTQHETGLITVYHNQNWAKTEDILRTLRTKGYLRGIQNNSLEVRGTPQHAFDIEAKRQPKLPSEDSPCAINYGWNKPLFTVEYRTHLDNGKYRARYYATVGDVNPIDYDGGYIFRVTSDGKTTYRLEYVNWDSDESENGNLYSVDVDRDLSNQISWVKDKDIEHLASAIDIEPAEWKALMQHPEVIVRARCLEEVAGYFGWENLDSYPNKVTRSSLKKRWKNVGSKRRKR